MVKKNNHKGLINCNVFAFSGQQLSVSMVIKIIMKTYAKIYLAGGGGFKNIIPLETRFDFSTLFSVCWNFYLIWLLLYF